MIGLRLLHIAGVAGLLPDPEVGSTHLGCGTVAVAHLQAVDVVVVVAVVVAVDVGLEEAVRIAASAVGPPLRWHHNGLV